MKIKGMTEREKETTVDLLNVISNLMGGAIEEAETNADAANSVGILILMAMAKSIGLSYEDMITLPKAERRALKKIFRESMIEVTKSVTKLLG